MTSRERVRRALGRKPTDRIPNGLGGCETAGMHLLAYEKLKKLTGAPAGGSRMSTFMATALFEPEVLHAIDGDMILLGSRLSPAQFWGEGSRKTWKEQTLWGTPFRIADSWRFRDMPDGGVFWEDWNMVCPPGAIYFDEVPSSHTDVSMNLHSEPVTPDDFCPSPDIPDEKLHALEDSARWLYENTDFSIVCGEMPEDFQVYPGGMMNWWMLMASEPDTAHEFLHKACEAGVSQFKLLNEAVGKYVDITMIAHDMGDGRGVTVGPDLWREIYKPHYMELFQSWHRISGMKICLHSCGAIGDILGDLIECGVDVINPVQVSATGMEPAELKKRFGDRVIFYGGAYDAVLNPVELPAETVYENVKRNIGILGEGGGYIFAGVHNIPGNVPESHIRAILAAYRDARGQGES